MQTKLLLFIVLVISFSSCSTAYKSGQTPDDVYYSPAKFEENKEDEKEDNNDEANQNQEDRRIRQSIRDRRWRDMDDYDYTFNNSPYNHCYCNCPNYSYYYNPKFYPNPIFVPNVVKHVSPRKVNLNSYQGYSESKINTVKSTTKTWVGPASKYNNSNKKTSLGSKILKVFSSKENISSVESNSSSNTSNTNNRSYTPSSSGSSNSSSGSKSSGSVSRPSRGGN